MTREEAIVVLYGLSDNPLFSNQHKAAFNIAIHDIKQRHDWDINNLILVNKENCEPLEQESVLDKIRAEIKQNAYPIVHGINNRELGMTLYGILEVIDKYKAESEDKE
jgi:hypothetical protein